MVTIDGQQITNPGTLEVGVFRLTKSGRTASGLMVMDIIAIKRKVELGWSHIAESELRAIENLLEAKVFHQVTFPDSQAESGERTMTAYAGDVNKGLWHRVDGVRYWESVRIPLIER